MSEGGQPATHDRSVFVPQRSSTLPGTRAHGVTATKAQSPGALTRKPEADASVPCGGVQGRGSRRGDVSEGEPTAISSVCLRDVAVAEVAVTPGGAQLLTLSPSGSKMFSVCLS